MKHLDHRFNITVFDGISNSRTFRLFVFVKNLVADLAPFNVQSTRRFRRENVWTSELTIYYSYLLKKKKKDCPYFLEVDGLLEHNVHN